MSCCFCCTSSQKIMICCADPGNEVPSDGIWTKIIQQIQLSKERGLQLKTERRHITATNDEDRIASRKGMIVVANRWILGLRMGSSFHEGRSRLELAFYLAGINWANKYTAAEPLTEKEQKKIEAGIVKVAKFGSYAALLWKNWKEGRIDSGLEGTNLSRDFVVDRFSQLGYEKQGVFLNAAEKSSKQFRETYLGCWENWHSPIQAEPSVNSVLHKKNIGSQRGNITHVNLQVSKSGSFAIGEKNPSISKRDPIIINLTNALANEGEQQLGSVQKQGNQMTLLNTGEFP